MQKGILIQAKNCRGPLYAISRNTVSLQLALRSKIESFQCWMGVQCSLRSRMVLLDAFAGRIIGHLTHLVQVVK